jgi:hypothetical protein
MGSYLAFGRDWSGTCCRESGETAIYRDNAASKLRLIIVWLEVRVLPGSPVKSGVFLSIGFGKTELGRAWEEETGFRQITGLFNVSNFGVMSLETS